MRKIWPTTIRAGKITFFGCYMYVPVRPVVLAARDGDDRPQFGPSIISARSDFVRVVEGQLRISDYGDGCAPWWDLSI